MRPPFNPAVDGPGYLYVKLADYLADRIGDHTLPPGAMLPCERNLAAEHHASVGTARRATQLLRERGHVITMPSKGTYVVNGTEGLRQQPIWLARIRNDSDA